MNSKPFLMSWNQFLAFSPLYAKTSRAENVFWPGCAAMKLPKKLLLQTYAALNQAVPGLGFSSWCCAKPTFAIGSSKQKQHRAAQLKHYFAKNNIKNVYVLCPNCKLSLSLNSDINVYSAWPLLAEYAKTCPGKTQALFGTCLLHDPCAAKNDAASQNAAREILNATGQPFKEFEHCKQKTRCCGRKDMLFLTDAKAANKMLQARLAQAKQVPIVSYCESCTEAFCGGGQKAVHLLEVLFGRQAKRSIANRIKNAHGKDFYA